LTLPELLELFRAAGLPAPTLSDSALSDQSENLLRRSFPDPKDLETLRRLFRDSVEGDKLGMRTGLGEDGKVYYSTPVAILVADVQ
jgi:hypothetical protein